MASAPIHFHVAHPCFEVYEIAPEDPLECVFEGAGDLFKPTEKAMAAAPVLKWTFPARSVSAVELELKA